MLIARQPIFNRTGDVYGYELFYREEGQLTYACEDDDAATSSVISGSFLSGQLSELTGEKKALINFTPALLSQDVATLFPKEYLVIDITEPLDCERSEMVDACQRLKNLGYTIALGDFIFKPGFEPFLSLTNIVKIDFLNADPETTSKWVRRYRNSTLTFLAEKLETDADYQNARALGYDYFQGYFFSKPVIMPTHHLTPNKLNALRLIELLNHPDVEFDELTEIIESDVSFSYEILKIVNSAYFSRGTKISSIREALVRLGMQEIRKWGIISALRRSADHNQGEIISFSMIRSKFMEMFSKIIGHASESGEYLTVGILSMIDVLMHSGMGQVLNELQLSENVKNALIHEDTHSDLYISYQLIVHCEQGNWKEIAQISQRFNLPVHTIADTHNLAIKSVMALNKDLKKNVSA